MADIETLEINGQAVQTEAAPQPQTIEFQPKPVYDFFKRVFDIVSSLIVSIILLIPIGIISLLIVSKDKGNPFYSHKRVGKG